MWSWRESFDPLIDDLSKLFVLNDSLDVEMDELEFNPQPRNAFPFTTQINGAHAGMINKIYFNKSNAGWIYTFGDAVRGHGKFRSWQLSWYHVSSHFERIRDSYIFMIRLLIWGKRKAIEKDEMRNTNCSSRAWDSKLITNVRFICTSLCRPSIKTTIPIVVIVRTGRIENQYKDSVESSSVQIPKVASPWIYK